MKLRDRDTSSDVFPDYIVIRGVSPPGTMKLIALTLVLCALSGRVSAWDAADLEIFDAVEEVNANFYEVLGVQAVS